MEQINFESGLRRRLMMCSFILLAMLMLVAVCNGRAIEKRGAGNRGKKDCSQVRCFLGSSDLTCVYRRPCRLHRTARCIPHEPNCCDERWVLPPGNSTVHGCGMEEDEDY